MPQPLLKLINSQICLVWVCMCGCVSMFMCGEAQVYGVCRPEDNLRCYVPRFFETESLTGTWNLLIPAKLNGQCALGVLLFLPPQFWNCKHIPTYLTFSVDSEGLNSGPHTCVGNILPTELSPKPVTFRFLKSS